MFENIVSNPYGGFILLGKSGTVKAAEDIAKKVVCGEHNHPDIHIIRPEDGSVTIKLEQLSQLRSCENMFPLLAKVNVFIIEHADLMREDCQSTLLKVLEDGCTHNCILLCCENRPMETICNRCSMVFLSGGIENENSVIESVARKVGVSKEVLSSLLDGREERLRFLEEQDGVGSLDNIAKMIESFCNITEPRESMFALGAMSETGEIAKAPQECLLAIISGVRVFFEDMLLYYNSGKHKYEQTKRLAEMYDIQWCLRVLDVLVHSEGMVLSRKFTHNDYTVMVATMSDKDFGCD